MVLHIALVRIAVLRSHNMLTVVPSMTVVKVTHFFIIRRQWRL